MSFEDRNVNIYNSSGRLLQLEYAMKAMSHGTTTIGICTKDSVLIISEKKITNKFQNLKTSGKNEILFDHIGFSFSGIQGDARKILKIARRMCLNHMKLFDSKMGVEGLLKDICHISMQYSESDAMKKILSRPFGASIMLGSVDETVPKLLVLDPSGTYRKYNVKAIGSADESLDEELNKEFKSADVSTEDAIPKILKFLGNVMQEKINSKNVEIMQINKNKIYMFDNERIDSYLVKI